MASISALSLYISTISLQVLSPRYTLTKSQVRIVQLNFPHQLIFIQSRVIWLHQPIDQEWSAEHSLAGTAPLPCSCSSQRSSEWGPPPPSYSEDSDQLDLHPDLCLLLYFLWEAVCVPSWTGRISTTKTFQSCTLPDSRPISVGVQCFNADRF